MADDVISTTGKWVTPEGRVVDEEPVEGRVLVAPGTPITPDIKAAIERAEAAAPPETVVEDETDEKAGDGDVETATAPSAKERATAPHKRASGR
jgi:hypothetical protein